MRFLALSCLALLFHAPQPVPQGQAGTRSPAALEKSAYFAFVDRDYIFTVEIISPGVPLVNFVSMTEGSATLSAKQIRVTLENRKVPMTNFLIDTGNPKEPVTVPSLTMRPRSSFGARMTGDISGVQEFLGVTIGIGSEDLKLEPLSSFAFENLVLKVNRINLGSPDFRDDWRALKLEVIGSRAPAPRRLDRYRKP